MSVLIHPALSHEPLRIGSSDIQRSSTKPTFCLQYWALRGAEGRDTACRCLRISVHLAEVGKNRGRSNMDKKDPR